MTEVRAWLAERTPPPPPPLARWLEGVAYLGDDLGEALLDGARAELDRARSAPGRVRASAFHLLAADALVTYACVAALDETDPVRALGLILDAVAAPQP